MKKTILILSCLIAGSAFAEFSKDKCSKVLTHSGDILIQRDWDETSRNCFISLHPMDIVDLKYRDYYFDNAGLFMVFNSYGDGPNSKMTGARAFYLFPSTSLQMQDYPDYSIEPNGDVLIQTVSGQEILFDSKKLKMKSFVGGSFSEKQLSPNNNGGTEIKPAVGFWLDLGFKLGGLANDISTNTTKALGAKSGSCSLKNTEIFQYKVGDYDHPLLYTGAQLELFLQKRCNIQF